MQLLTILFLHSQLVGYFAIHSPQLHISSELGAHEVLNRSFCSSRFFFLFFFYSDEEGDENVVTNNVSSHNRAEGYDEQNDYLMRADGTILKKGDSNANGDTSVIDYKKGYVLRKCCYEPNGKRSENYFCYGG